jgi:hypothetical protein
MCMFVKVLRETGRVGIVVERLLVLVIMYREASSSLSAVCFVAVWAG